MVEWLKCRAYDQHALGSKPTRAISDGFSKLGARGKDSRKLVFSKKKGFDLGFPLFFPKS